MLVSVVVITYNQQEYIIRTLEGILNQNVNFDVELIISNDASPDDTNRIVEEYLKGYSGDFKIRYYNHTENKGMQENFIWAISQAEGKYIALCEGDDEWIDTDKLNIQVNFMEKNPHYTMCGTKVMRCFENGDCLVGDFQKMGVISLTDCLHRNRFTTCTVLLRREKLAIPPFENYFSFFTGDWPLWCSMLRNGDGYNIDVVTARYNIHQMGAVSGRKKQKTLSDKILDRRQMIKNFPSHRSLIKNYGSKIILSYVRDALLLKRGYARALGMNLNKVLNYFLFV